MHRIGVHFSNILCWIEASQGKITLSKNKSENVLPRAAGTKWGRGETINFSLSSVWKHVWNPHSITVTCCSF